VAIQISAGQFEGFDVDPKTKSSYDSEYTFRKALGLDPEREILKESLESSLAEVSRLNRDESKRLMNCSDSDLNHARDELQIMVCVIDSVIKLGRDKHLTSKSIGPFKGLYPLLCSQEPRLQALVLWCWLPLRNSPGGHEIVKNLKDFKTTLDFLFVREKS